MSALSPRRRSALRAAVTSAALASAVLTPAAAAFADAPAAPVAPAAPAAKAVEGGAGTTVTTPAAPASAGKAVPEQPKADKKTEEKPEGGKAPGAGKAGDKDSGKVVGTWWPLRTVTLADGTVVEVYESGPETHRADVMSGDAVVKSVKADGRDVTFEYHGMTVTLTALRGEILTGSGKEAGSRRLPDGSVVKSYRLGDHYRAEIVSDGEVVKVLNAFGKDVTVGYKAWFVTVNGTDGSISYVRDWDKGGAGQGPVTSADPAAAKCRVTKEVSIGAGTVAILMNDLEGPKAGFKDAGDGEQVGTWIDRKHPELDEKYGFLARIEGADSSSPKLVTGVEGGLKTHAVNDFPALPEGCAGGDAKGAGTGAAKATNASVQLASSDAAQTKAIPEGGVAAGAEGVREGNDAALAAAVGGFAAVSAAGIAFTVLRRRAVGVRG
ncbi:hypothetical protein ACWD4B_33110 [Streptomyces sp. NPDC002536]